MSHATTLVPAALARALQRAARELMRAWPQAVAGEAGGVHKARVASRRLREVLPVAGETAGTEVRSLRRRLRRVTRALGRVREVDVTRALLLDEAARRGWPAAIVARVDRACATERLDRRQHMLTRLEAAQRATLAQRLDELHAAVSAAEPAPAAAAHLDDRICRRALALARAIAQAGTLYEPEALHAVRIATKKLRYVLEVAHGAARLPVGRDIARLKRAQEDLGALHDLQVLQQTLQAIAAGPRVDRAFVRRLEQWNTDLEAECRERHARFLARAQRLVELSTAAAGAASRRLTAPAARSAAPRRRKEHRSS